MRVLWVFFLLLLSSCAWHHSTTSIQHLESSANHPSCCFLVLLVTARHLDYSNGIQLLKSVTKHPSDGSKNCDVGHAWILLYRDGKILEGGHTGEFGLCQPGYFEGVLERIRTNDSDPISYLWETQNDGIFQKGSGGFRPTYAAKVDLTDEQYRAIYTAIHPLHYDYIHYALTSNQCASFVAHVASLAGLSLACEVTVPIKQTVRFKKKVYKLWSRPEYSEIVFASPDVIEQSLKKAVREGIAENALAWYQKERKQSHSIWYSLKSVFENLYFFPSRFLRARLCSQLD